MSYGTIRRLIGAAALAAVAFGSAPARAAASFSDIYFFGDSLSDTGNILAGSGGTVPVAPYFPGRFSDGPVWTEKMASLLGHASDAQASLTGGKNFAFGGARTDTTGAFPNTGVLAQVGGMWNGVGDPNALYVVVAGGNDMRDARSAVGSNGATRQAAAQTAINNLKSTLSMLDAGGAKFVMVANLPDLGHTPEAAFLGKVAESSDATNKFNALMPSLMTFGQGIGLNMTFLDLAGVSSIVRLDALSNGGAIFGITNATLPCAPFGGAGSCSTSLFSDGLHPSARAHEIIGLYAASAAINTLAAVPEPETYALMLAGLAMVAGIARRRRAVAA